MWVHGRRVGAHSCKNAGSSPVTHRGVQAWHLLGTPVSIQTRWFDFASPPALTAQQASWGLPASSRLPPGGGFMA